MKKIILIVFLFSGCSTVSYRKANNIPLKENKNYFVHDSKYSEKISLIDNIVLEYSKGGDIEYKGKFLGSGIKILNRIIEIEIELLKLDQGDKK